MAGDLFDPDDFATPPPKSTPAGAPASTPASDPGADYRTLLDAMRKAGAEGVGEATNRILVALRQEAEARAAWQESTSSTLKALQEAAGAARSASESASQSMAWLRRKMPLTALLAALMAAGVSWASLAWQRSEVADLKAERERLTAEIAADQATAEKLRLRGANLTWSTCTISGTFRDKQRKCIRITLPNGNRDLALFGNGPYYVVPEGY